MRGYCAYEGVGQSVGKCGNDYAVGTNWSLAGGLPMYSDISSLPSCGADTDSWI